MNLPEDEYEDTYSLVRSRYIASKGFGLNGRKTPFGDWEFDEDIIKYLHSCVSVSEDFPKFFNPVTGKSFPLSRYYKNKSSIYGFDDAIRLYFESDSSHIDSVAEYDDKDYSQLIKIVSDYEKRLIKSLIVAIMIITPISLTSCSSPKTSVRVRNNANGTETSINVRNGEGSSTSVNISPSTSLDSLSFKFENNGSR